MPELIDPNGAAKATLVSLMSANNETGVIQPIQQAAQICRSHSVDLHVDATQSVGKVPIDVESWGASAVTIAAHKFHGPPGVGALWLASGIKIRPTFHGGQQQLESRPGTEPVALVAGMAKAIQIATEQLTVNSQHMQKLRDQLESSLIQRCEHCLLYTSPSPRDS